MKSFPLQPLFLQILKKNKTYTFFTLLSGMFMLLTMLWLTISTPFVYAAQQNSSELSHQKFPGNTNNTLLGATEEKNESGCDLLTEFLIPKSELQHQYTLHVRLYKFDAIAIPLAFHPERVSPPPEVVS